VFRGRRPAARARARAIGQTLTCPLSSAQTLEASMLYPDETLDPAGLALLAVIFAVVCFLCAAISPRKGGSKDK
jgi:hypothetical protein